MFRGGKGGGRCIAVASGVRTAAMLRTSSVLLARPDDGPLKPKLAPLTPKPKNQHQFAEPEEEVVDDMKVSEMTGLTRREREHEAKLFGGTEEEDGRWVRPATHNDGESDYYGDVAESFFSRRGEQNRFFIRKKNEAAVLMPPTPEDLTPNTFTRIKRSQKLVVRFNDPDEIVHEQVYNHVEYPPPKHHPWTNLEKKEATKMAPSVAQGASYLSHGDGGLKHAVGTGEVGFENGFTFKNFPKGWRGLKRHSVVGSRLPQRNGTVLQDAVVKYSLGLSGRGIFATRNIKKGEVLMVVDSTAQNVGYNDEQTRLVEMSVQILRNVHETIRQILEGAPEGPDGDDARREAAAELNHLHQWVMTGQLSSIVERWKPVATDIVLELLGASCTPGTISKLALCEGQSGGKALIGADGTPARLQLPGVSAARPTTLSLGASSGIVPHGATATDVDATTPTGQPLSRIDLGEQVLHELELHREHIPRLAAILYMNGFLVESTFAERRGSAFWPEAALYNHSCDPNATYEIIPEHMFAESEFYISSQDEELREFAAAQHDDEVAKRTVAKDDTGTDIASTVGGSDKLNLPFLKPPPSAFRYEPAVGSSKSSTGARPKGRTDVDVSASALSMKPISFEGDAGRTAKQQWNQLTSAVGSTAIGSGVIDSTVPLRYDDDDADISNLLRNQRQQQQTSPTSTAFSSSNAPSSTSGAESAEPASFSAIGDGENVGGQQVTSSITLGSGGQPLAKLQKKGDEQDQPPASMKIADLTPNGASVYLFCCRAEKDIAAGEEILIPYVPPEWSFSQRQEVLLERYKFRCKCPKCSPAVDSQRNFSARFMVGAMIAAAFMFVFIQYVYSVFEVDDEVTAQRRREYEEQRHKDVMRSGAGSAFNQSSGGLDSAFPDIYANDPYSKMKW